MWVDWLAPQRGYSDSLDTVAQGQKTTIITLGYLLHTTALELLYGVGPRGQTSVKAWVDRNRVACQCLVTVCYNLQVS